MECKPTECRYLSRSSHVVLSLGADGTIREIDRRRPAVLGYKARQLTGHPLAAFVAEPEKPHVARLLERCETGQPVWDEVVFVAADGHPEPMICCLQSVPGREDGAALLLTGTRCRDSRAAARAEAAAALGHLSFRCHRPVHRLMHALQVLLADETAQAPAHSLQSDLDAILEALSRAASWPTPGKAELQATEIVRLLADTLQFIDADPDFANVQVRLRPDAESVWARVHPVGLACVALHLVSAARDAASGRGGVHLNVDVHPDEGRVILEFSDDGPGLTRDETACAFAPIDGNGARGGLALATCCELVHFMDGTIRLEGHRGRGTRVRLAFPAATPPS